MMSVDATTLPYSDGADRAIVRPSRGGSTLAASGEERIGARLRHATDMLLDVGGSLRLIARGSANSMIGKATGALADHVYRITVIGQMKAGKSSLINALIRRPQLLPTNVNPWTTVATKLHFATPGNPQDGMLFRFFSEDEWHQLAEQGGPLREILNRVEPQASMEELPAQLEALRRRTKRQLGRSFHHLLGKQHNFARTSGAVLARYVCAPPCDMDVVQDGRFADITKSADVYLDRGPFAVPAVVIDTPGVNDPALLRDRMTLDHLRESDVCLIVLNAEQALATTDLALLRLLHGLHKDRVIVFVNRIDALNDPGGDTEKVLRAVRRKIAREFPGSDVTVIAGSAWWAERALRLRPEDLGSILTPALLTYGKHIGVLPVGRHQGGELPLEAIQDALLACAGVPALAEAIGERLAVPVGLAVLDHAVTALKSTSFSIEKTIFSELLSHQALGEAVGGDVGANERQLKRIQNDVRQIDKLARDLTMAGRSLEDELRLMGDVGLERLRIHLRTTVGAFAEGQAMALSEERHLVKRVWRCDILPLRQTLADQFVVGYRRLLTEMQETERAIGSKARRMFEKAAPGYGPTLDGGAALPVVAPPSTIALGQVLAFDLGSPWIAWWKLWRHAERRATRLRSLIISEFELVIDDLIHTARGALDSHIARSIDSFRAEVGETVAVLKDRQKRLATVYVGLLEERRESVSTRLQHRHEKRLEECHSRISELRRVRERMDEALAHLRGPVPVRHQMRQ